MRPQRRQCLPAAAAGGPAAPPGRRRSRAAAAAGRRQGGGWKRQLGEQPTTPRSTRCTCCRPAANQAGNSARRPLSPGPCRPRGRATARRSGSARAQRPRQRGPPSSPSRPPAGPPAWAAAQGGRWGGGMVRWARGVAAAESADSTADCCSSTVPARLPGAHRQLRPVYRPHLKFVLLHKPGCHRRTLLRAAGLQAGRAGPRGSGTVSLNSQDLDWVPAGRLLQAAPPPEPPCCPHLVQKHRLAVGCEACAGDGPLIL